MTTTLITLSMHPVAYTLTVYKGVRCLCITSRPESNKRLLMYIELNPINLSKFKTNCVLPDTYIIATLLSLFDHIPYTSLTLEGMMSIEQTARNVSYFVPQIHKWYNNATPNINSNINTLFFDIEVESTASMFPIPDKNSITCISFRLNTDPTLVLTTFPIDQLRVQYKQEFKEYIQYESEYSMIEFFIHQCMNADRIVQYNGNSFDWPFLLARFKTYTKNTSFWTQLSEQYGSDIRLDTAFYPTPFGMKERLTLSIPTLEHVDLLYVCKRLFPFWANTKLDTAGRELTNTGKFSFEMKDYFQLIEAVNGAKNIKEQLTPKSLELLRQALLYSKIDCDVLVAIYEKLSTYRILAHEFCYLCAQDWSESTEAVGLLSHLNPCIIQVVPTKPTLKLTIGLYKDVSVFVVSKFILSACKNESLKIKLSTAVSVDNIRLIDFFQLLAQLYDYTHYIDQEIYNQLVKEYFSSGNSTYVGSLGAYIYGHVSDIDTVYTHDALCVPAPASWLSVTITQENKVSLDSKGKAKICQPMPAKIEDVITRELATLVSRIGETSPTKYVKNILALTEKLFPKDKELVIANFVEKSSITLSNYTANEKLLTVEEQKYLLSGGEFVTIETIETTTGIKRVYFPYTHDPNIKLDITYYVNMLSTHLATLNKIITVKDKT